MTIFEATFIVSVSGIVSAISYVLARLSDRIPVKVR